MARRKAPVTNEMPPIQPQVTVPKEQMHIRDFNNMVANALASRQEFFQKFFDPRRNINKECGYPETGSITAQALRDMYDRDNVAARVVQLMPKECWQSPPEMVEDDDPSTTTEFEGAWDELGQSLGEKSYFKDNTLSPLWDYLKTADELCGIGYYGILLLIVNDDKPWHLPLDGVALADPKYPSTPTKLDMSKYDTSLGTDAQYMGPSGGEDIPAGPRPTKPRQLLGIRTFDDSMVQIVQYEANLRSPRFGRPIRYLITMNDPRQQYTGVGLSVAQVYVHWTRVIHLADNRGVSPIFGVPRMRPVLNRLLDLQKLYGGSAEMYWKGAFPGISIETNPQLGSDVTMDMPQIRADMTDYMNGLQRYLTLQGLTAKTLAPQVSDPTAQINTQLEGICIQLACPKRVFMGSERGELASTQDDASWNDRLTGRNRTFTTPRIIVPFTDRLIQCNVLPIPKQYKAVWPDLNAMTDQDKATIGLTRTQALVAYIGGNGESLVQPMDYLTKFLDFTDDDSESMLDATQANIDTDDESGRLTPDPAAPPQMPVDADGNTVLPSSLQGGSQDDEDEDTDTSELGTESNTTTNTTRDSNCPQCGSPNVKRKNGMDNCKNGHEWPTKYTANEFEEEWRLVRQQTTENFNPSERRDKQGRWTSGYSHLSTASADAHIAGLTHVKTLGGSTGATLVQDAKGKQYVMKKGTSEGHIRAEFAAEQAYRALGVSVPRSRLYETSHGPVKLSEYKKGLELGQHSAGEIKHITPELQKHFAAHALLANWDVVGAKKDNILLTQGAKQKAYHIDTGGALDYRAMGGLKQQHWNGKADEFHTLRSPTNAASHAIFGSMTNQQLKDSVAHVLSRKEQLLNALPEKYHDVIKQRLESLKAHADKLPADATHEHQVPALPKPSKSHLESVEGLTSHLSSTGAVSKTILKKIQDLNPNGIENGVLKVSLDAVSSKIAPHLPAGVVIQKTSHKALFGKSKETKSLQAESPEAAYKAYEEGHTALYGTPIFPSVKKAVMEHIIMTGYAPLIGKTIPIKGSMSADKLQSLKDKMKAEKQPTDVLGNPVSDNPMFVKSADQSHHILSANQTKDSVAPAPVESWKKGLSIKEQEAISTWKSTARFIRRTISKYPPPPPDAEKYPEAHNFYTAISKAPMVKGQVYRGISGAYAKEIYEHCKNAGIGGTWSDHAPMCMSPSTSVASKFSSGDLMLSIKTKTGRTIKWQDGFSSENEVTAMPGVTHKIVAVHTAADGIDKVKVGTKTHKWHIELEEV